MPIISKALKIKSIIHLWEANNEFAELIEKWQPRWIIKTTTTNKYWIFIIILTTSAMPCTKYFKVIIIFVFSPFNSLLGTYLLCFEFGRWATWGSRFVKLARVKLPAVAKLELSLNTSLLPLGLVITCFSATTAIKGKRQNNIQNAATWANARFRIVESERAYYNKKSD